METRFTISLKGYAGERRAHVVEHMQPDQARAQVPAGRRAFSFRLKAAYSTTILIPSC